MQIHDVYRTACFVNASEEAEIWIFPTRDNTVWMVNILAVGPIPASR
jgi:hypothetical protein